MRMLLKPNKNDFIIGSVLLLLIISLIISLASLKDSSDHYVYIKYDKQIVHQMDLYEDEVFVLYQSDYENFYGDVEITVKNKKVAITKNVCPEEFCKHMGWIDTKGYSLICAPNRLVVEIGAKVNLNCDWGAC